MSAAVAVPVAVIAAEFLGAAALFVWWWTRRPDSDDADLLADQPAEVLTDAGLAEVRAGDFDRWTAELARPRRLRLVRRTGGAR